MQAQLNTGSAGKPAIEGRNWVAACCTGQCADKLASEPKETRQASMGTGKSKPPWLCYVIIFLCKLVLCMLMGYWHVRVFVVFNRAARVVAAWSRWNLGLLCVFAPDQSVKREKSLWGSTPWRLCLGGTKRDLFARGPHQFEFLLCQSILEALTGWSRGRNLVLWTKTLSPSRTTSPHLKPSSACTRRMK